MIEPSDADLHARILARDEEAFSLWESRTAPAVLRMLHKRGLSSEDAEEVWNDTLAVTWGRALREPPIEPLGGGLRRFAFGVARRLTAKRLGARSRLCAPDSLNNLTFSVADLFDEAVDVRVTCGC